MAEPSPARSHPLDLPLDPAKSLASLEAQSDLYGIVIALLAATLVRTLKVLFSLRINPCFEGDGLQRLLKY